MPTHIHLIISDVNCDIERLGKTLAEFRKFTGNKLADSIDADLSESLAQSIRAKKLTDRIHQIWKPGWHAEALSTEKFLTKKLITYTKTREERDLLNYQNNGGTHQPVIGLRR